MRVVIVGAGQAGFQVAASLRDGQFEGEVLLVGEETSLPYQRPPLSKAYLTGDADASSVMLRAPSFYAERAIGVRTGDRVAAIDRGAARIVMQGGETIPYDHLVLATGARNRILSAPGVELDGVLYLRGLEDADRIKAALENAARVAIIGAGFIGLEFAAVAARRGLAVTVYEAQDRVMARAVSRETAAFVQSVHEAAGIQFEFWALVEAFAGRDGRVTGLSTLDGRRTEADLVLIGIGVVPNEELATEAGLPVANGISVDAHLLTLDPAISALGDCASHPSRFASGPVRIESVQNAVDQGKCVAQRLLGHPVAYASVPWFWSDQGTLKIQMAGLPGREERSILRGDPGTGAFSVFRYTGDRLSSVESVNRPADHMAARRLLEAGINPSPEQVSDSGTDLKSLLSARRAAPA